MTRILFLITMLSGGGAEHVMLNLIENLPKDKFDIQIVSLFKDKLRKGITDVSYRYIFPIHFRGNVQFLRLFSPGFLYKRIVGDDDYDIVISYWESPTMRIVSGAPRGFKGKLVNWIHNEFKDLKRLRRMYKSENEFMDSMHRYDATVFVAESAKENLCGHLPFLRTTSHVVYNVIDSDTIAKKSKENIEEGLFVSENFNIVSVGRLAGAKGFDRLIRFIGKYHKTYPKLRLYLLGEGPLEKDLKSLSISLGVEDKVIFLGYKENPYKYVAKADLFACSSLHEGYSTAVSESIIVGTPVVTTECSGMREQLGNDNEYGLIVPNEEQSLHNALLKVLEDKSFYDRLKSKVNLRKDFFSKDNLVKNNILLFNQLTGTDE